MPASPRNPERLLRRLEWTVVRRLDGLLHGDYRTLFRGYGLDLADLREYQYHDDVRHIDWNVTARLQSPYVREYQEEREVSAWFLIDLSPSVEFGSRDVQKRAVAIDFLGVIASLLARHGNRVGALFYGDTVDAVIPARGGRAHVLELLQRLLARPARARAAPTRLTDLFESAARLMKRRALAFVISDFVSLPGWHEPLARLARRHEVLAVRVHDPLEQAFPDLGLLVVEDAETGEQLFVDSHDPRFRRRFAAAAERREQTLRRAFADAGVDALELSTEDDLVDAVVRFADMRRLRHRGTARPAVPVPHLVP